MDYAAVKPGQKASDNRFAALISFVFNPLFLPPPLFAMLMPADQVFPAHFSVQIVWGWALLFYTIIPLFILLTFKGLNRIESLEIPVRTRRTWPYIFGILSYIFGYITAVNYFGFSGLIPAAGFTLILSSMMAALINLKWKISVHNAAVAISAVFIAWHLHQIQQPTLFIASCLFGILVMALMCWSRITLKAHTPAQAFSGILFGLLTGLTVLFLYPS